MNFDIPPEIAALRERTRQFIAEQVIPLESDPRHGAHGPSEELRRELVARARDVTHWNALRDRGVTELDRELFESSLQTGQRVLQALGLSADEALTVAQRFKQHNTQLLADMYPHHKDRSKLIAVARQGRQQLEEQMARERAERTERTERTDPF